MTSLHTLTGLGHIMITPFLPDESVDEDGLASVVDYAVGAGVSAVIPLGIMGEAHKLTDAERDLVVERVVSAVAGRVPVIAGCTAESTRATVQRVRRAAELGAAGVMVAPPRALAGAAGQQVAYYRAVCDAADVPVVVQDEPVTTGVAMSGATLGEIVRHPTAVAVKVEQVPSPTKISAILDANPDARCFGGLGGLYAVEELDRGAVGVMTGFALPDVLVRICAAHAAGDRAGARRTFFQHLPLIRYEAQLGVGGVSIRKQLFVERGIIRHDTVRGPAPVTDPRTVAELRGLIEDVEHG
ncbi:dihydrodipicolinate synthase family protein [Nakamurella endophytica]|uniref:Dihydrodipicolinate synthase family protein n=1 Tax=Nakamurella endophytica TaxID=1748367 RepID=A0A917SVB9_9ACTN|nr:dihydrodipicolinate synthase family protein [Nakamurella endophytica]GGL98135.1 dihydrodipicolinate synthase family protein [Nakamurella endophytica]